MITTQQRITYARCLDANIKDIIKIAIIFKMVYSITDVQALAIVNEIINNQKN